MVRGSSTSAREATGFDLRLVLTQARYALLLSFRDPRAVVFGIAFPIVLLVMFNAIFVSGSSDTVHSPAARSRGRLTSRPGLPRTRSASRRSPPSSWG
jgi:hypothetical protein